MSKHLPALKPAEVLRVLQREGFRIDHKRGSHYFLLHPEKPGRRVTLPFHNVDLKRRTLTSIIEQAGFTIKEFVDLL